MVDFAVHWAELKHCPSGGFELNEQGVHKTCTLSCHAALGHGLTKFLLPLHTKPQEEDEAILSVSEHMKGVNWYPHHKAPIKAQTGALSRQKAAGTLKATQNSLLIIALCVCVCVLRILHWRSRSDPAAAQLCSLPFHSPYKCQFKTCVGHNWHIMKRWHSDCTAFIKAIPSFHSPGSFSF